MLRAKKFLVAVFLLANAVNSAWGQEQIPWITDLRQARQLAEQQQRVVLLHFWSESCPPCRLLEQNVFNQPELIRVISAGFIPVKINVLQQTKYADFYKVDRVPDATVHQAHLTGTAVPPSQCAPVPADVDGLVAKAMERNAAKRYLTVRQFLDDIERLTRGDDVRNTAPFGRAGKQAALAQTMLGVGPSPVNDAKTRQMDVDVPAEALRDAAGEIQSSARDTAPAAGSPWSPPADAPAQVYPPVAAGTQPTSAPPAAAPQPAVQPAPIPLVQGALQPQHVQPHVQPGMHPGAQVYAPGPGQGHPPMMQAGAASGGNGSGPSNPSSPTLPPTGASGKKKPGEDRRAQKGKFRETMWFKKGDLDAAAAEAAAEERAQGKEIDLDRADNLPIDERYKDDGSINSTDAQRYSLKTGGTQVMPAIREGGGTAAGKVSEDELIDEMKGGRNKLIIAIAIAVILLVVAVVALLL